jgi:putative heme-binding domain-containing protein
VPRSFPARSSPGAARLAAALALAWVMLPSARADEPRPLFDGASLAGWETIEADRRWWTVADGAIVGGSLTEDVPHNTFLATKDSFHNFELTLRIRIRGGGGFVNSGIQIRSIRVPGSSEMQGYQVDAGPGWWGKLYDESRRNKVIAEPVDAKRLEAAVRPDDWNEYRIRAEGPAIRSWINGVPALDYKEADATIATDGHVAIQVHDGGKARVEVKDVTIRPLPPTPGAAKWPDAAQGGALKPADEARQFTLADGFKAELVLAESGTGSDAIGKFVALAFDARGRLWTTTALEYPVDANESPEASRRLFESGGRDKVVVVDRPFGPRPSPARVFADGLAMPLGVLPHQDGAFVQYGGQIRFYRDANGDGRADGHDVVLEGFGVQDSHLFPHQFTRVPGGWILLAQGLFNSSAVRRPGGAAFADGTREVRFDACKLGRFRPDGSRFEPLTAGPNNIWGLTIARTGETWLQEANDLGFPIFPYEPGVLVPTGSSDRLRPYQPMMPAPLGPPQMGGTGLSGLAVADDADGWPAPWGAGSEAVPRERIFYVANPLTNSIQSIVATRAGQRYTYRKGPDLLVSDDKRFRPVAAQFGPDGCLYVVDWYNAVISHNEVPRSHPDRDRTRGRIWRIRHASQPIKEPLVVADVPTDGLPALLGAANARIADLAWQEIVDRDAKPLVPRLESLVGDATAPVPARLGGLWALEGLGATTPHMLERLVAAADPDLRHEAVRIAGATCSEADFRRLAAVLVDDPSPRVRAAVGDALRRIPVTEPDTIALIMRLGRGRAAGTDDPWTAYDRDFERYLARWALEMHSPLVSSFLDSPAGRALPVENRLLATLVIDPKAAAAAVVAMIPQIDRPLDDAEIRCLATQADVPAVAAALARLARDPKNRLATLRTLLALRTSLNNPGIGPIVAEAAGDLFRDGATKDERLLGVELAGAFGIRGLEPQVARLGCDASAGREIRQAAIRALREIGSMSVDTARSVFDSTAGDARLRADAIAAWAESRDPATCAALVAEWEDLSFPERQRGAAQLARHREGAGALLAAIDAGTIDVAAVPFPLLVDMRAVLPQDPVLERIWNEVAAGTTNVLRLSGNDADAAANVSLAGPFTVEAWVNLEPGIGVDDSLLAAAGIIDMNFHEGRFRVWTKAHRDVVVAKSRTLPDTWTHYAVTRDAAGVFRIYIDGDLDAESTARETDAYDGLRIGSSMRQGGTRGRVAEFRVWNVPRTADEIRSDFDRSYLADDRRPPSLVSFHGGSTWGDLSGDARVEPAPDAPALVTAAALAERAEKFARFRRLAEAGGDAGRGRAVFAAKCLTCHQQGGQGGRVGPALDGVGLAGVDAMLRHVLTPSAAMEGGYRSFRVVTRDGRVVQGLLVSRNADAIVLRQPDTADVRIDARDIDRADFTGVSVMPEGLLESMPAADVSDLFAHLGSLKATPAK